MDMDTVVSYGSLDQSLYKSQIGNPRKIHKSPSFPRPYGNMILPSSIHSMGILQAPPPFLFHSYPSYSPQKPPQPPLLPLPAVLPARSSSIGGLSRRSPAKKNSNGTKNSKSPTKSPKEEEKKITKTKETPKNVTKAFPLDSLGNKNIDIDTSGSLEEAENQVDMLPGFRVFSPPPSSLPLPSFSLRSKHSCNAEAAGVDAGATDNLRRLLRLQ